MTEMLLAVVNISYFCGKVIEDQTTAITSPGCYAQHVRKILCYNLFVNLKFVIVYNYINWHCSIMRHKHDNYDLSFFFFYR